MACGVPRRGSVQPPSGGKAVERLGEDEPGTSGAAGTPAAANAAVATPPASVSGANTPGGAVGEEEKAATPTASNPPASTNAPSSSPSATGGEEEEAATPTAGNPPASTNAPSASPFATGGGEEEEAAATPSPSNRPGTSSVPGAGPVASGEEEGGESGASGPSTGGGIDQFITSTMQEHNIPGLAALVIKGNQVVMAKGYGVADKSKGTPVTPDTDFLISSCSKTIGAVTLMQLYDQGKFNLATDINTYLPFSARNPNFPDTPITARQLLTHRSSIARDYEGNVEAVNPGDPTVSLADFYRSFFASGTTYYSDKNFDNAAPGSQYEYSNTGAALWAYLAEALAGQPFYQLSQQSLFSQLGMTNTGWRISDVDGSTLATLYDDRDGNLVPVPAYSYIDYPSGSVRTSTNQLAKFLMMFMNGGQYNGVQLLSPATVAEMQKRQIPQLDAAQGLGWHYSKFGNDDVIGHDGEDTGSSFYMYFRPSDNTGVIILMNVRDENETADGAIAPQLFNLPSTGR
jgi:CubicO group peptidase (beta-lactamase class C family)